MNVSEIIQQCFKEATKKWPSWFKESKLKDRCLDVKNLKDNEAVVQTLRFFLYADGGLTQKSLKRYF